ncbi:MAG: hypothetical protein JOY85_20955 [Acidobacteriaceae bacterium]|nr:hypothetical protein [Acidobacteriaceae bacterium]
MTQSLELPTELFEALQKTAEANGMSPAEWIASVLPAPLAEKRESMELWEGLLGVFDSRDRLQNAVPRTHFGDLIAAKLEKQGITRPK